MADSNLTFEVVVTEKGLNQLRKQMDSANKTIKKTDKSFNDTTKSARDFDKQNKSIYQSNLSSAKSFSKMNQTIGSGSSGLVGAYATLAANVFAATAAFNALRSAAQVETLAQGFEFLANASGRTSSLIAQNIREITNSAISLEQALRSSAIAVTSGFDTTSIEDLTRVARNASIALGRNMEDSLDRLFRGVAKLEPEILDELGIMVRLDSAVETYAARLGKGAQDLTDFERRQAFLNATIAQGALKYGDLEDAIDPNPYDQLAAAFADLTKTGITLLNTFVTPLISLLAGNKGTLLGVLVLFASTIVSTMFPVLQQLGERQIRAAQASRQAAEIEEAAALKRKKAAESLVLESTGGGKGMDTLRKSIKEGTNSQKDYTEALKSLSQSERQRENNLSRYSGAELQRKQKELQAVRNLKLEVARLAAEERNRSGFSQQAKVQGQTASAQRSLGQGTTIIQGSGGIEGFKKAGEGLDRYQKKLLVTARTQGEFTKKDGVYSFNSFGSKAKFAFKSAAGGARLFGAALINAIPLIGQIIFISSILIEVFTKLLSRSKEYTEAVDRLNEVISKVDDKFKQLDKTNSGLTKKFEKLVGGPVSSLVIKGQELANTLQVIAGVSSELSTNLIQVSKVIEDESYSTFKRTMIGIGDGIVSATKAVYNFAASIKGALLNAITTVAPSLRFLLMAFNAFADSAPTEDELKISSLIKFAEETEKGYEKILKENDKVRESFEKTFGKDGLVGFIEQGQQAGKSYTEIQSGLEEGLKSFDLVVQQLNAESQNLNKALAESDKLLSQFQSGLSNKNQFDKIADNFEGVLKSYNFLKEGLSEGEASALFSAAFTAEQISFLSKFEVTATNAFKRIEDEAGNSSTAFENFVKQVRDLADKERFTADDIKLINLLEQERAAQLALNVEKEKTLAMDQARSVTGTASRDDFEQKAAQNIYELRLKGANDEFAAKQRVIDLEYDLLEAKLAFDKTINDAERTRLETLLTSQRAAAKDALDAENKRTKLELENDLKIARAKAGQEGTLTERSLSVAASDIFQEGTLAEKVNAVRGALTPLMDDLKALGPEGALVSEISKGALVMADAFAVFGSSVATTADKIAAIGTVVSQIGSILAANSKAQIANIDSQIEAEKKRDGKSQESLQKIQALEKKKDQMARKAFETNKKMQIASAIISTAAAVAGQLSAQPIGPWNYALAAAFGALGMAQVAIIRKQQYQGSGGDDAGAKMTALQIGGRSNAVDVARQATAGELNYIRGGRTTGENLGGAGASLPGSAMGRRGYADGAMLVGERGPEVVAPSGQVDVIPNYALGGGNTNVNFTINAVDGASVENMLYTQRGNIIGMIREAANANGEGFLESVDPAVYGGGG